MVIEEFGEASGDFRIPYLYIYAALVAAAEGNSEEAEQLIRRWQRVVVNDKTDQAFLRHEECRVLGMAKATTATVECIRAGLENPSFIIPFLEPHLPYYDSMRDEPEFIELLAEIEEG